MPLINTILAIVLLRQGPQELPFSRTLFQVILVLYIITGLLAFQSVLAADQAIYNMIADASVILIYTYLLLWAFNRRARYLQTVTAMLAVGCLFHLLAWPLLLQTVELDGVESISPLASLFMLMLLAWSLVVNAHIYREAMQFSLMSAMLLSFSLFFISLAVSRYLVPG